LRAFSAWACLPKPAGTARPRRRPRGGLARTYWDGLCCIRYALGGGEKR
jgi:hypothetical protein